MSNFNIQKNLKKVLTSKKSFDILIWQRKKVVKTNVQTSVKKTKNKCKKLLTHKKKFDILVMRCEKTANDL